MDEIIKKWRIFLKEDNNNSYQIYCDMDGVLVDLVGGLKKKIISLKLSTDIEDQALEVLDSKETWQDLQQDPKFSAGANAIFDILDNPNENEREQFWTNLPPKEDMTELWSYIEKHNPIILSAPWRINGKVDLACEGGKKKWININGLNPKKVIITHDKETYSAPNHILIDDMDLYLKPWSGKDKEAIAIKHTSASTTIGVLRALLKKDN